MAEALNNLTLMVLTIGVEAVLVGIFIYLRSRLGHRYMTLWAAGWALGGVAHLVGLVVFLEPAPTLMPLMGLAFIAQSLLMLGGSYARNGHRLPRFWYAMPVAAIVPAVALSFSGAPPTTSSLPFVLVVGAALVTTGARLFSGSRTGGSVAAGLGFIGFGVHQLDFVFAVNTALFGWGIALAVLLEFIVGVGLVMLTLEQAQAATAESEVRQRAIIENAVDAFFRCTSDGAVVFGNAALARLVGVGREALPGTVLAPLAELARLAKDGHVDDYELVWTHGSQRRAIAITARSFVESGRELWEGFIRDITRSRLVDAEHAERTKLEALGRLAGGIAHDFNNLLVVIQGGLQGARSAIDSREREEMLRDGEEAATRASELTRQLLDFGRQVKVQAQVSNVRDVFERSARLLVRAMGERMELSLEAPPQPPWVAVPPTQLTQVLLNLVLNARDAMPKGGKVVVRISGDEKNVCIDVADTGGGMDEATRRRIFEPFFSTKGAKGTGLGLATVHAIVEEAKGRIEVDSEVGKGTTFHVWLPRAAPATSTGRVAPVLKTGIRVLVVDDDDGVRRVISRTLADAGYEVVDVPGAQEALDALRHKPFDVLLTDVVMPGTRGPQLANQATAVVPNLKVVFISGHPSAAEACAPSGFLSKPFTRESLLTAVADDTRN